MLSEKTRSEDAAGTMLEATVKARMQLLSCCWPCTFLAATSLAAGGLCTVLGARQAVPDNADLDAAVAEGCAETAPAPSSRPGTLPFQGACRSHHRNMTVCYSFGRVRTKRAQQKRCRKGVIVKWPRTWEWNTSQNPHPLSVLFAGPAGQDCQVTKHLATSETTAH